MKGTIMMNKMTMRKRKVARDVVTTKKTLAREAGNEGETYLDHSVYSKLATESW